MDHHVTHDDLLAYCLGACPDDEHARTGEHLLECGLCLRAFLEIKRHVEGRGARDEAGMRPRPEARARLRASVEASFRPAPAARIGRALRRPIPLYQGLAAAALAVAVAVLWPMARDLPAASGPFNPSGARVDSSRAVPESFDIY